MIKKFGNGNGNTLKIITGILLTLVIGVASFLRFYKIGKLGLWSDEISTMDFAGRSLTELFQVIFKIDPNMGLYYLIVHYWIQIFPNASEGVLRALSAIFSVASIPIVFLLGRTLGANRKQATAIGLIAALLITVNSYNIQYAQELRSYSLLFLLATLSTFLLIKAVEQSPDTKNPWWIWYAIVSAAAVWSHYYMVLILIAQVVSLLILLLGGVRKFPIKGVIGSYIATAILIAPVAFAAATKGTGQISWISKPTFNDVRYFAVNLAGNQGVSLLTLYLLAVSIGLLAGVMCWSGKDLITKWKFTLIVSCLFVPVITALVVSKIVTPIFVSQYLLFVMPYLAVLAAAGITTLILGLRNKRYMEFAVQAGIVLSGLFLALSIAGAITYFETFQKEDWRGTTQFLTENCSEGLRLYDVDWTEMDVKYYNTSMSSQLGWKWNQKLNENPNSEELAAFLPNEYNQVCLVVGRMHIITQKDKEHLQTIQNALLMRFPSMTKSEF